MIWRDWVLSNLDHPWIGARRTVDGVRCLVMVRPRGRGGYRAHVERETWPVRSCATVDRETAVEALDAAAREAGVV